ncbi:MAG: TonB-dependent receptor [Candidatus Omnitrophica bacterium]|nr:TonB-dependent receptor [Candidatus Omnitrophota bacterium]
MFRDKLVEKFLVLLGVVLGTVVFSYAADVDLDRIVVTPYGYGETLEKTASSVTVVTAEDIENSNAEEMVDVLRPVAGVVVRDYYGNGTTASVDMGGFGEQAALNVLVLVDGRRINDADLSGVDWKQIPLDRVERIEVIRGGSGAVLYGDNASSGVINIITKKGEGKPKINLQAEYGSYDMNKQKLSLEGGINNKFSYLFNIGRQSTHGYRKNTFVKDKDFASKLGYEFSDLISVHFDSGFHASTYGMPSGLFQHHINEHGRRWARYGEDHANNKDYYFVIGSKLGSDDSGSLNIDFSYRQKATDSYFLTSHNDTRKNEIETYGVTPKYALNNNIFGHDNKFIAGLDLCRVFYNSRNYPYIGGDLKSYTNINKDSVSGYLHDEFSIFSKLVLVGGYRYELARYAFGYHDFTGANPDRDAKLRPDMQAFDAGVAYTYMDDSSLFFNAAKSFRFPEVDEFTGNYDINFHQFLNTNLKAQSAMNYQVGVRHKFNNKIKGSCSLFRMDVNDYIYYNPTGGEWGFGENENYDKTVHEGIETSLEVSPKDWVTFFGNYSFTKAYFEGGVYNKNYIPMVPRHKAMLGLKFILPKNLVFNISGNFVGKRYFINDQANAVSELNGYMVADTNLSWRYKDLAVVFGINNLFDKQYSEYGVYGTDSSNGFVYDKCYFPSPGRNFSLKVNYSF